MKANKDKKLLIGRDLSKTAAVHDDVNSLPCRPKPFVE